MNIKEFEEKNKKIINKIASLLLSIGIHGVIITGILIISLMEFKKEKETVSVENRIKVVFKEESGGVIAKKIIKKNGKKEKRLEGEPISEIKKEEPQKITYAEKTEYPNKGIELSYGIEFFILSKEEQEYIIENWEKNNKINETISIFNKRDMNTSGISKLDKNIVSFYLEKDGNISEVKFVNKKDTNFEKNVKKTIEKSSIYYKKPEKRTLIKIYVGVE